MSPEKIAFIGMGEAGSAFVEGWGDGRRETIAAYDIKADAPGTADAMWPFLAHFRRAIAVLAVNTLTQCQPLKVGSVLNIKKYS